VSTEAGPRTNWRVLRYEVKTTPDWQRLSLTGPPLYVAARNGWTVELWVMAGMWATPRTDEYRAFATGEQLPVEQTWHYVGTAVYDRYVWHLIRRHLTEDGAFDSEAVTS
jgi:hypothetical protein